MTERDRASRTWWVLGRLRPGVSLRDAQAAVDAARASGPADRASCRTPASRPRSAAGSPRSAGCWSPRRSSSSPSPAPTSPCSCCHGRRADRRKRRSASRSARAGGGWACSCSPTACCSPPTARRPASCSRCGRRDIVPALFFVEDAERARLRAERHRRSRSPRRRVRVLMVTAALLPLVEVRDDDPAAVLRRESGGPSNTMRRLRAGLVVGTDDVLLPARDLDRPARPKASALAADRRRRSPRRSRSSRRFSIGPTSIARISACSTSSASRRRWRKSRDHAHGVGRARCRAAGRSGSRSASSRRGSVAGCGHGRRRIHAGVLDAHREAADRRPDVRRPRHAGLVPGRCIVNEEAAREVFDGQALGRRSRIGSAGAPRSSASSRRCQGPTARPRRGHRSTTIPIRWRQPFDRDGPATFTLPAQTTPDRDGAARRHRRLAALLRGDGVRRRRRPGAAAERRRRAASPSSIRKRPSATSVDTPSMPP